MSLQKSLQASLLARLHSLSVLSFVISNRKKTHFVHIPLTTATAYRKCERAQRLDEMSHAIANHAWGFSVPHDYYKNY